MYWRESFMRLYRHVKIYPIVSVFDVVWIPNLCNFKMSNLEYKEIRVGKVWHDKEPLAYGHHIGLTAAQLYYRWQQSSVNSVYFLFNPL